MEDKLYDVIITGNGPAGLSAAINVRQRNGSVLVIGLPIEGNPLYKAHEIDNYLGMEHISGADMLKAMHKHAEDKGVEFCEERLLAAYPNGDTWMVSAGSDVFTGRKVVFAGGVVRGKAFEGEEEFLGRGVSYCTTCDGMLYKGREVSVIGFSEADRREAAYLEGICSRVDYFERPKKVAIRGDKMVTSLEVDGQTIETACVFVLRPTLSPASIFPGLAMDGNFIKVDRQMRTNLPGLFAAGDCTGRPLQVAKAVGEGMVAGQMAMQE